MKYLKHDLKRFAKNIAEWSAMGFDFLNKGDRRMAKVTERDVEDLKAVYGAIVGGEYSNAAKLAWQLDTVVREQIPTRLYNFIHAQREARGNPSVAETILAQLGGNKFIAMTGAKDFVGIDNGLMFRLPSRATQDGINKVIITLSPTDLYDIQFGKTSGRMAEYQEIAAYMDVSADQLQNLFTSVTGLDTHL
jgi:hypothetical protein